MIDLLHGTLFLFCFLLGISSFSNLFINSAVSVPFFIPSGGRVAAARLNRHMIQNRI
ncbi:hypothetical protein ACI0FR_01566 [Paenochrobactrum sp. BZR 201-1]